MAVTALAAAIVAAAASAGATEVRGATAADQLTPIRVALAGERGKTGAAVAAALAAAPGIDYVGGFGRGTDAGAFVREHGVRVLVDFTLGSSAPEIALAAITAGASPVIGATGLAQGALDDVRLACQEAELGGIWAPNFSIGAVVLMWLVKKADPYFEGVEIVEAHHATKIDRPSGTAAATAGMLGREVPIHSVRLPGLVADQSVIFGLAGQTLTIAHRTTSRDAYGPGVVLAVRRVVEGPRWYTGLQEILGLG